MTTHSGTKSTAHLHRFNRLQMVFWQAFKPIAKKSRNSNPETHPQQEQQAARSLQQIRQTYSLERRMFP